MKHGVMQSPGMGYAEKLFSLVCFLSFWDNQLTLTLVLYRNTHENQARKANYIDARFH